MNNVNSLITELYFHGKSYSSFKTLKLLKSKNCKKIVVPKCGKKSYDAI